MEYANDSDQVDVKHSIDGQVPSGSDNNTTQKPPGKPRIRSRRKNEDAEDSSKRRCVSTACIACRYALRRLRERPYSRRPSRLLVRSALCG